MPVRPPSPARAAPPGRLRAASRCWRASRILPTSGLGALLTVLVLAAAGAGPALAADIFVTTTTDGIASNGNCTLREAVRAANLNVAVDACAAGEAAPVVDVVVLTEKLSPYRLTVAGPDDATGDLDVFTALDIVGAPSTIDATGLGDRVLDLRAGAEMALMTVNLRGGDAGSFHGGGIRAGSAAKIVLFRSSVRGNRASFGAGLSLTGGATAALHDSDVAYNESAHAIHVSSATLAVVDSTVADNVGAGVTATDSTVTIASSAITDNTLTGLHAAGTTSLVVRNSTLSDNGRFGQLRGGGLLVQAPASATLYYVTVSGNEAAVGGGVHVTGALTLKGSIVGDNRATNSHPDCYSESATMTSQGSNLLHRDDCELVPLASDRVGLAPGLDVLADWGGPTRSRRLLPGSPAVDGGDPADFPLRDQRGEGRPRHGDLDTVLRPDIGAHENGNTIVVSAGFDASSPDGNCSLRDALRAANSDAAVDGCRAGFERDLIWIDSAVTGVARLMAGGQDDQAAVGDFDVRGDVDVAGLPHRRATVDGGSIDRVFEVFAPARLRLSHLAVTAGSAFLIPGGGLRVRPGAAASLFDVDVRGNLAVSQPGGGALVEGELEGEDVWFDGNETSEYGGAIALDGADARLELSRVRITGNRSTRGYGGGIAVVEGTARLADATVAANLASGDGGGLYSEGTLELRNATIAYNRADSDAAGGGTGGGIRAAAGTARLQNSIVADNLAASSPDCAGTLLSRGFNLLGVASCSFTAATGDLLGVDAELAPPLAGVYSTLAGSPARDAGSPDLTDSLGVSCSRRDGVSVRRPLDGDGSGAARCDIGAVESIGGAVLDIDGDGEVVALTDGLLVLRWMFGMSGDALVLGVVQAGAPRSTAAAVAQYLTSIAAALDVDGNGDTNALTDGLLVLRYLFGLSGVSLTGGAIGSGATRSTAAEVIAYLDLLGS
jgi:CSLREA domain-containing protein